MVFSASKEDFCLLESALLREVVLSPEQPYIFLPVYIYIYENVSPDAAWSLG